jgi:signal transduction histidine kinase
MDDRIEKMIDAAQQLKGGKYQVDVPESQPDEVGRLGSALRELAVSLELRYQEMNRIKQITAQINAGWMLEPILEGIYRDFRPLIPFNRIGFSQLEDNGKILRSRWSKTDRKRVRLEEGYAAPMEGSSLQTVMESREPRILNDLVAYLAKKPESESTRLIVQEGFRSSLTCPLVANGVAVGFIFFSSVNADAYANAHVEVFKQIADQLAILVEKGRLISELAERDRQIELQNEEMRHLNYLKNFFLGTAVHDLRNPIGNIQLISDVLMENSAQPLSQEELQGFVKDINQQARYMAELMNDILSVAEIETGQVKLVPVDFDLATFLHEAARRFNMVAEPKHTRVVLENEPAGKLRGDPQRLRQVIDHLLSNAVKYSPPGSVVRIFAEPLASGWRIKVKDQGPGILEKDRPRLFSDFGRLSSRSTGGEKSTGLGLAISRRLVEAHGGKIGAENLPDKGTIFWFEIP